MPNIKCTNCGAVLKTPTAIAPGKKVKCPKCNEPFIVQADEEVKKPAPEPEEEEGGAFKDLAGSGGDAPSPKKKGKPAKGDEDDDAADGESEDGEDGESKKGKKKSNKNLILIIVACVLVFCCCPSICGTIYSFFGAAIQTAVGIGGAAAQKKAMEDAAK